MVHIQANNDFLGSKESFHAEVSTLDTLLGYTEKDDREGAFEASVFAELFREMLEARFGRSILRTLELLEKEDRWVWPKSARVLSLVALAVLMHDSLYNHSCLYLYSTGLPFVPCMTALVL